MGAILVQGVLTGMGREAECEILAWQDKKLHPKVNASDLAGLEEHSRARIESDPSLLTFGRTLGSWSAMMYGIGSVWRFTRQNSSNAFSKFVMCEMK